jgi:hypothetical protein
MSVEYERLEIPMDLELKWVKTKLHERDKHILKLAEENSKLREDLREDVQEGISLRDHFAGLGMLGTLSADIEGEWSDYPHLANHAYQIADAMLAERKKKR